MDNQEKLFWNFRDEINTNDNLKIVYFRFLMVTCLSINTIENFEKLITK